MDAMVCQACGQREATVLVSTVVHNHVTKTALCASCAAALQPEAALDALTEALAGLSARARAQHGRCHGCRTSFADFRESGRFGCPRCYDHFAAQVRDLLPRVHAGAYHHRGKTPGRR
jgi:protein arginine kinase activator